MYRLVRPLLFKADAERVHTLVSRIGSSFPQPWFCNMLSKLYGFNHPALHVNVFGIDFPNPVGLAAGYDKRGVSVDFLAGLGFGCIEVGTVTPRPQPGNPKPRLFNLCKEKALLNRMGFNNEGVSALARRLSKRKSPIVVGANIGKNKDTSNEIAWQDYVYCLKVVSEYVDYVVVNVSSPNTRNLQELQEKSVLQEILNRLQQANIKKVPILLKIAPELSDAQVADIVEVAQATHLNGIIATNTLKTAEGGLSGQPLQKRSLDVIRSFWRKSEGSLPIIGVGGVFSAEDAYAKIKAGASLVQVYTGLVYEGPGLVKRINQGLVELMKRDGFSSIKEAVGKG